VSLRCLSKKNKKLKDNPFCSFLTSQQHTIMQRFKSGLYKISLTLAKQKKEEATADIQFSQGIFFF